MPHADTFSLLTPKHEQAHKELFNVQDCQIILKEIDAQYKFLQSELHREGGDDEINQVTVVVGYFSLDLPL